MVQPTQRDDDPRIEIRRYFAGLAENTFQSELGVVDPRLIDYLTDLLIRSVRNDVMHRVRSVTGKPLTTIHEMFTEASERLGLAKRELLQHIGDFTLFWAGIYPEALRDHQQDSARFDTYRSFGKRSYMMASSIEANDDSVASAEVLQRLADRFDLCCYGLREVRRQWESGDGHETILLN